MLLSRGDVRRLEGQGYRPDEFSVEGSHGLVRLRNLDGWCYFYDRGAARCRVYEHRPVGCSTYPVIYSAEEGVIVDEFCPECCSVTRGEREAQGKIVVQQLRTILSEARLRRPSRKDPTLGRVQ